MRRKRIIIIGTLVALAGVAAPLGLTWQWSQQRAIAAEQQRLRFLASHALQRAERTFRDASTALHSFAPLMEAPCSDAHIQQMRRTTVRTRSIDDIGYFENGVLKCTSSGMEQERIKISPPQFLLADGVGVDIDLHPSVSAGKRMVGAAYLSHKVLIDPVRFADVLTDEDIQLAMAANNGALLGTLHDPDPALVKALMARGASGSDHDAIYAVVRSVGLTAIVIEPRSKLDARLRNEQIVLLPLGLLFAALSVAAVVWLSRRRLSLRGELKIAVERREFFVHYQPIIALDTCAWAPRR